MVNSELLHISRRERSECRRAIRRGEDPAPWLRRVLLLEGETKGAADALRRETRELRRYKRQLARLVSMKEYP